METNHCDCQSQAKMKVKSIDNSLNTLRRLLPSRKGIGVVKEEISFFKGRFCASLEYPDKNDKVITNLVAVQESLGIIVLKSKSKFLDLSKLDKPINMEIQVMAGLGSGKKLEELGKAIISINAKTSEVEIIEIDETISSTFERQINWGDFVNCARSYCVGGYFSACNFSSVVCGICLIGCAIASIED